MNQVQQPSAMIVAPRGTKRRHLIGSGLGIFTLGMLPGAGLVRAQAKTPVMISEAIKLGMYVSAYTARRKGLFAKHGLEATIVPAGGIALPVPVLLSGRGQFSITGPGMAVNSTLEGGRMKVIAKMVGGVAMWAVGRPGSKISSLDQFKNKTLATLRFPSSTIQTPTYTLREHGGFDPKEHGVKFLELPPGAQAQAVKDGRADYAPMFEWDVSIATRQFGLEVAYSFADAIGSLAWTTSFVTEDYLGKNREVVQAYCNALAEAQKMLHTDPSVFVEVSQAEFPQVDKEAIQSAADNFLKTRFVVPRNPTISKPEWEAVMKLEMGGGAIKQTLPYEQMVDNSFALKAAEQFGLKA
ncbi:MAG: putative ABC-type nitrate/sulfonate/bicarbonate transport [Pseudomonadota bacterium]|jgi:NitT/TauT family transport system substrate-binding protein